MKDMMNFRVKVNVEIDEEGNISSVCPECRDEIKVAFENIKDENLTLIENITCPLCSKEISQVYPSSDSMKQILTEIKGDVVGEVEKELKNVLKKFK